MRYLIRSSKNLSARSNGCRASLRDLCDWLARADSWLWGVAARNFRFQALAKWRCSDRLRDLWRDPKGSRPEQWLDEIGQIYGEIMISITNPRGRSS